MENEIKLYINGALEVPVTVTPEKNTVWLNRSQLAILFDRDIKTIGKHINNALHEELDNSVVAKFATTGTDGKSYMVEHYNLDMIISIGYRVKSKQGVAFRKWATSILKDYIIQGVAVNNKRLKALNKVVNIQSKIIAHTLELEEADVLKVVKEYTTALELLDNYDHQKIVKPLVDNINTYRIDYMEARKLIDSMSFSLSSNIFGVEKTDGALKGILDSIYQSAFHTDAYPSPQEKASNLLYFIVKDHPFVDGCKRIAASLFLYFLDKNGLLFREGHKIISDSTLVAITILVAESKPEEKEIMIDIIMNFLQW